MIDVFTSVVYIAKQNADISQTHPIHPFTTTHVHPSTHPQRDRQTDRHTDREREREREREGGGWGESMKKQEKTQKQTKSISNQDTMRAYQNYITTHREMWRLVRVFTATSTVMLYRINNTKYPQDFKLFFFFFFFFF